MYLTRSRVSYRKHCSGALYKSVQGTSGKTSPATVGARRTGCSTASIDPLRQHRAPAVSGRWPAARQSARGGVGSNEHCHTDLLKDRNSSCPALCSYRCLADGHDSGRKWQYPPPLHPRAEASDPLKRRDSYRWQSAGSDIQRKADASSSVGCDLSCQRESDVSDMRAGVLEEALKAEDLHPFLGVYRQHVSLLTNSKLRKTSQLHAADMCRDVPLSPPPPPPRNPPPGRGDQQLAGPAHEQN